MKKTIQALGSMCGLVRGGQVVVWTSDHGLFTVIFGKDKEFTIKEVAEHNNFEVRNKLGAQNKQVVHEVQPWCTA